MELPIPILQTTSLFHGMNEEEIRSCAYVRLFEIARQAGCRFTVGSDAHDICAMDSLPKADWYR